MRLSDRALRWLALASGPFVLALSLLVVRVWLRGWRFELSDAGQVTTKLVLGVLVAGIAVAGLRGARRFGRRRADDLLVLAASLSVAAWLNVGFLHGNRGIHLWEHFHYFLGSRYFAELGYDGLYVASIGDQADRVEDGTVPRWTRDLRTNEVVATDTLLPHMREVYARFTSARWAAFSQDHAYFLGVSDFQYLTGVRKDHGYNASPTWTALAQWAGRWRPASEPWLEALSLLDVALMIAAFSAIYASFGLRTGCLCLLVFGWSYVAGYDDLGGSFLRFDWVAATAFALCALKRERPGAAGALFGVAAALRVFPVLFLFGPALLGLRALLRGERPRWLLPLGAGFGAALALCIAVGCLAGRGAQAWPEFAREIRSHSKLWLSNNVGLENLVIYDRAIVRRELVDLTLPEPWSHPKLHIEERRSELHLAVAALRAAFLLMLAAAVWRLPLIEGAVAGMAGIFALTSASAYYWVMLMLLPLGVSTPLALAAVALNLATRIPHVTQPSAELDFLVYSWGMALLFVAWLGPPARATVASFVARYRDASASSSARSISS
jgi:hypothetical protein